MIRASAPKLHPLLGWTREFSHSLVTLRASVLFAALLASLCILPVTSIAIAAQEAPALTLRVAVAANFREAAEQLGARFSDATGAKLLISSASTGVLVAQIQRGAPFDVLLAANATGPQALLESGKGAGPSICYARGSLVLLGADSLGALADSEKSIAIANPRSAPYGAAAVQVLNRPGFAGPERRRVVRGSNVQQAAQFYATGATDLALIARSLSPDQGIAIPPDWHAPIDQHAVVTTASAHPELASQFIEYLRDEDARRLLGELGYQPCS